MIAVFSIGKWINKNSEDDNEHIKKTAEKIKDKFKKYWRDIDCFCYFSKVKLYIVEIYIGLLYANSGKVDDLKKILKYSLTELYVQY